MSPVPALPLMDLDRWHAQSGQLLVSSFLRVPAYSNRYPSIHPSARRPLIVVLNRVDTASSAAVAQWKKYLVAEGGLRADNRGGNVPVFFVDSKRGRGVHEVRCDAAADLLCIVFACAGGRVFVARSVWLAAAGNGGAAGRVRSSVADAMLLLAPCPCLTPPCRGDLVHPSICTYLPLDLHTWRSSRLGAFSSAAAYLRVESRTKRKNTENVPRLPPTRTERKRYQQKPDQEGGAQGRVEGQRKEGEEGYEPP